MKVWFMSLRLFIVISLLSFLLINSQSYSMQTEEYEDWSASLNVVVLNKKINLNKWHTEAKQYLNDTNRGIIQSRFEKTEGVRNIASFRFSLLYRVEGVADSIKFVQFAPSIIFISGLSKFENALLEHNNEQHLRNRIKNARSFQDENLEGKDITSRQYQSLIPLIGESHLTSIYGNRKNRLTDAEVSIVRFLSGKMPSLIRAISDHESNKVTIIGSIFQIASLFDSCKYCLPLLAQYGNNLQRIVRDNIPSTLQSRVSVQPAIDTLLLISGNQVYGTSRDNMAYIDRPISMNFDQPSVRTILAKVEDLNEQGINIEDLYE
jgi:hypothetical protein